MGCSGNCGTCGGCGRELVLTEREIAFLKKLGQCAFLPVARTMADAIPVCLEEGDREEMSLLLQCLEKKGLISLDYDKPLKGFEGSDYAALPHRWQHGADPAGTNGSGAYGIPGHPAGNIERKRIMSIVKNEPKYKNGILQAIRAQLEHRAHWLYLLCDEAGKRGLDWKEFGNPAVRRCGLSQGKGLVEKGGTDSLKGLRKTLFTKPAQLVFEMDILESTDDTLSIDFHYCPLVKAWQKAGCTDEEIATLCDIAMCGDHAIGECYGAKLDLPKCIAKGDDVCSLRYHKS